MTREIFIGEEPSGLDFHSNGCHKFQFSQPSEPLDRMMLQKRLADLIRWMTFLGGITALLAGSLLQAQTYQSVTLAWDPSPDPTVVGYRLHYGISSESDSQTIDVGDSTTATVSSLTAGYTYFFVVTAYDTSGLESLPSNQAPYQGGAEQSNRQSFSSSDPGEIGRFSYYVGAGTSGYGPAYALNGYNYFGIRGYRYLGGRSMYLGGSNLPPRAEDFYQTNYASPTQFFYSFQSANTQVSMQQAIWAWNYFGYFGYQSRGAMQLANTVGTLYEKKIASSPAKYWYYAVARDSHSAPSSFQAVIGYFGQRGWRYSGSSWFQDGLFDVFEKNAAAPVNYGYRIIPVSADENAAQGIQRWNYYGGFGYKILGRFQVGEPVEIYELDTRRLKYGYAYQYSGNWWPAYSVNVWNFYGSCWYRALGSCVFRDGVVDVFELAHY